MTPARERLARQYVYDMINSFVVDPETGSYPHLESTPPSVSFYFPDFKYLLRTICKKDSYSVTHPDLELLDLGHSSKYDIDDHCIHLLNGTIYIRIDGVSFDHSEIDEFMRGYKKGLEEEAADVNKVNKFHVNLS